MKTFKQHLKECVVDLPNGIFVKTLPITSSILIIKDRLAELEKYGTKIMDDLHCTVIYSMTPASGISLPVISKKQRFHATGTHIEYWDNDSGNIVLCLESEDLMILNKQYVNAGIVSTHPEYKPHVTLQHPVTALKEIDKRLVNLSLRQSPLELEFYFGGYTIID